MKNQDLIKILEDNSTFEIDQQVEEDQVVIWFQSFGQDWSICYQNGDMSGGHKGKGVWDNDGANYGLDQLEKILLSRPEFDNLVNHEHRQLQYEIEDFINEFCRVFRDKHDINNHFNGEEEVKMKEPMIQEQIENFVNEFFNEMSEDDCRTFEREMWREGVENHIAASGEEYWDITPDNFLDLLEYKIENWKNCQEN
jgi:hypothetical protein